MVLVSLGDTPAAAGSFGAADAVYDPAKLAANPGAACPGRRVCCSCERVGSGFRGGGRGRFPFAFRFPPELELEAEAEKEWWWCEGRWNEVIGGGAGFAGREGCAGAGVGVGVCGGGDTNGGVSSAPSGGVISTSLAGGVVDAECAGADGIVDEEPIWRSLASKSAILSFAFGLPGGLSQLAERDKTIQD